MYMVDLIGKKRRGEALNAQEIRFFVQGSADGTLPDYQISALLMAICLQGMDETETAELTMAMARSGDTVDLSRFGSLSVDKHSTGGVGDKTTLIVAPLVAALGGKVAKMSGRGLGYTGGTIDKLESIPGFRTALEPQEFFDQVECIGLAVAGQTGNLAPADKRLYALRDVTATVDSLPLIASSVMSKKIAAGSVSIVLDVKCGSGAFMKTPQDAETLAREMVRLGKTCGRNMAALITDMDTPLGRCIGNALEVQEAVQVLKGEVRGPLRDLCVALATQMLSQCRGWSEAQSAQNVSRALDSGLGMEKMRQWVDAQGGNSACLDDFFRFKQPRHVLEVAAPRDGYVQRMDAQRFGEAAVLLGAGRLVQSDAVDPSAGIYLNRTVGESVQAGQTLFTLRTDRPDALPAARDMCLKATCLSQQAPAPRRLIYSAVR